VGHPENWRVLYIDVLFPLVGWLIEGFVYAFNNRTLLVLYLIFRHTLKLTMTTGRPPRKRSLAAFRNSSVGQLMNPVAPIQHVRRSQICVNTLTNASFLWDVY
jgi:hypothetical protein